MEFDTGSDVQPGHDISIDSSQGSQDLGEATYDSDHDGIADSVIVIQDDHEYVITDSDHDGHADSMHAYDADGNEVDPKTGAPVGDSGSDDGSTGTSTSGTDTGTDSNGSDTGASSHTSGDSSGTSSSSSTGSDSSGDSSDTSTATTSTGHDITVTGDDGSAHSLGVPTVDLDKDGSPDTAVQHNDDGSITGYTDRDGDGHADQITQIGADGKVVIAVSDGNGGWEVAATGHVDSSGALVKDSTPDPNAALSGTDSDGVTTGHAGTAGSDTTGSTSSGSTDHGSTSTTADHGSSSTADTTTHSAGTDSASTDSAGTDSTSADAGTDDSPGTQVAAGHAPSGDITFTEGGKDYDLGAPTADMNGDGTPDTVVTHLDDGTVVAYSDTDGDGTTDQVTQLAPDGQVTIGVPDGHGGWQQAATGHIGSDGKFVPDQTTAGASTG